MRYMLDTCTFLYFARDFDCLDNDVAEILRDPGNVLCVSAETACELIQGFNCGKFSSKRWKTSQDLVHYLDEFGIQILPIDRKVIDTYSHLEINIAQNHKDPFDHIIIAHAMAAKMPLISSDHKFRFYCSQGLKLVFNEK